MDDIKEIARAIIIAHGHLNSAHKAFNALNATDREALAGEERKAWQAVVAALDAISPIYDWAIDNY